MSTNTQRTTAGLVGDFLAGLPAGQSVIVKKLAEHLGRDRGGVMTAVNLLEKAKAISTKADPEDLRRTLAYMTPDQLKAWKSDAGAAFATLTGISLDVLPVATKAAEATRQAAQQRREQQQLRFAVWSDGALAIEGLTRKQLTLPAVDVYALAQLFASFPEGALQALCDSPLKPAFTLHVDGREYPMTGEQTLQLVAYIEQLPARAIQPAHKPDHRVHRLETPEDKLP